MISSTSANSYAHNGPVCSTCGKCYVGIHRCSREDIARRIADLARLMDTLPPAQPQSSPTPWRRQPADTTGCPCRPENGGSGVCGCVLGGPQITCSTV